MKYLGHGRVIALSETLLLGERPQCEVILRVHRLLDVPEQGRGGQIFACVCAVVSVQFGSVLVSTDLVTYTNNTHARARTHAHVHVPFDS